MSLSHEEGGEPMHTVYLPDLLGDVFGISRSEARRCLAQGAVKVEGVPVTDLDLETPREVVTIELGKRRTAIVDLEGRDVT